MRERSKRSRRREHDAAVRRFGIAARAAWLYSSLSRSRRQRASNLGYAATVEATQSQTDPVAPAAPHTTNEPATRLVIRIALPKDAPRAVPESSRPNRFALKAMLGAIALVIVGGVATVFFRSQPASAPESAQLESPADAVPPHSVESTTQTSSPANSAKQGATAPPTSIAEAPTLPDTPPTAINEVVPEVPQSALDTIRGTVRVAVRVVIDEEGSVVTATSDNPGPSRYFERLSLEAARKWTFTPAPTPQQRTMILHFHYTREGPTARASMPE